MKNKLSDLNNYLFESLERINDDSLTDKQLEKELAKANTTATIALAIVKNADTTLKGAKFLKESGVQINSYDTARALGLGGDDGKATIETKKMDR